MLFKTRILPMLALNIRMEYRLEFRIRIEPRLDLETIVHTEHRTAYGTALRTYWKAAVRSVFHRLLACCMLACTSNSRHILQVAQLIRHLRVSYNPRFL